MVLTMLPGASVGATPPDVLHLYESFTLTDDFSGSIIIWGNDVTLDCAGYTVSGPGWAPDPSQQQPLRPGSAAQRLADALGTPEIGASDPADPRRR